ncbi:MAG TPA: phosphotransferase [Chloroflexota bacterium]|nr:phosphotransferase [Chloroflexota bacterium]
MGSRDLDPAAILAHLGVSDATAITPVSGGYDTAIWRVECPGGVTALRVFRPSQGESFQREVLAMEIARKGGIPVPELRATGAWQERPVMLLSWLPGRSLGEEVLAHPWRLWPLGVRFGRMQAAIHAVPVPDQPQLPGADWIGLAGSAETALQERLRGLTTGRTALIHLDYHPLNVLTDGRRITAVLDWTNGRVGEPRADFARTVAILCLTPAPPRRGVRLELLLRWLLAQAAQHGYQQIAGSPDDLALFYAWAGAMLVQDLLPRAGRPERGFRPEHFQRTRRWVERNKRQAGIVG